MDITEITKDMSETIAKMTQKEKFEFLRDAKIGSPYKPMQALKIKELYPKFDLT